MDNLVVPFRFASLTPPAGGVDNRQADSQVTHSLPARFAYGLTRAYGACLIQYKKPKTTQILQAREVEQTASQNNNKMQLSVEQ